MINCKLDPLVNPFLQISTLCDAIHQIVVTAAPASLLSQFVATLWQVYMEVSLLSSQVNYL